MQKPWLKQSLYLKIQTPGIAAGLLQLDASVKTEKFMLADTWALLTFSTQVQSVWPAGGWLEGQHRTDKVQEQQKVQTTWVHWWLCLCATNTPRMSTSCHLSCRRIPVPVSPSGRWLRGKINDFCPLDHVSWPLWPLAPNEGAPLLKNCNPIRQEVWGPPLTPDRVTLPTFTLSKLSTSNQTGWSESSTHCSAQRRRNPQPLN